LRTVKSKSFTGKWQPGTGRSAVTGSNEREVSRGKIRSLHFVTFPAANQNLYFFPVKDNLLTLPFAPGIIVMVQGFCENPVLFAKSNFLEVVFHWKMAAGNVAQRSDRIE
jgi:hypothetical protein